MTEAGRGAPSTARKPPEPGERREAHPLPPRRTQPATLDPGSWPPELGDGDFG